MYTASSEGLNKETQDAIYFFTPAFHPLDNFSANRVSIWDKEFPTSEHAFQWKKFSINHTEIAEQVLDARSPEAVYKIVQANKDKKPTNWSEIKLGIMEEILRAKLEQNADVQETLLKTGKREIIENSPIDSFWGNGPEGKGENNLGKIWMKIRDY